MEFRQNSCLIKNILNSALIISVLLLFITSCRKGEDDPFFSFRSRKARITGEWKIKHGKIKQKDSNSEIIQTYDGNYRYIISDIYSDTIPYQEKWIISKNGNFEITVISEYASRIEGTWSFGKRDKSNDLKNKESIVVQVTRFQSNQNGTSIDISYSGNNGPTNVYVIKELRNKIMTINHEGTSTENNSTVTYSGSITYKKE